jgi:predicted SAM-dependent methyltransferase
VDDFFDGVFTEHVLEHFNREEGLALLNECRRVLTPGGFIRIIVPDGEKIIKTYFDNRSELLRHRGPGFACAMDIVNSYFRQGYEHQFMYDGEMLQHQLSSVGFACIRSVSFKQGKISNLLIDNEDYEWESLYMEAEKLA